MAVRTPLYNNAGNIQEMSATQIQQIKDFCTLKFYSGNPVELQVDVGNGNIGSISDTRLQAGAASTSATAFPSEATTAEPSVVTNTQNNIKQILATTPTLTNDTGNLYPVYYDSQNNIQAMNLQDMKDTFIHPVIDTLASTDNTSAQAGTYFISTSSTAADGTKQVVSATPVYTDTRADTSLYTAGGIGETLDQPTTITNYYLHRIDGSNTSYTAPFFINASNHLQEFDTTTFNTLLQEWIRYTAASSTDGYAISYSIGTSGSGNTRGSGIVDTKLNGSGNYQTRFVNADDYRAQEFPNGTATTIATYFLRINKA